MTESNGIGETTPPGEWSPALPEKIPGPTAWPAGLALGVACIAWGIIASPVILGMGLAGSAACLAGWIGEIRHE